MANGISKNPNDLRAAILDGELSVHMNRVGTRVPKGFITRRMLMEKTGLTQAELKQLEAHGRLRKAKRGTGGYALYAESVIAELVASAPGNTGHVVAASFTSDQASDIFQRLGRGEKLTQIVIDTTVHPDILEIIKKKYERFEGTVHLSKITVDKIAAMSQANFPIDCEDAVLDIIETSVRVRRCAKCGCAPSRICVGCAKKPEHDPDEAQAEEDPASPT